MSHQEYGQSFQTFTNGRCYALEQLIQGPRPFDDGDDEQKKEYAAHEKRTAQDSATALEIIRSFELDGK